MTQQYFKLVRDRIPEIIARNGEKPIYRQLSKEEMLPALLAKLVEEAKELQAAKTVCEQALEIVDLLEVLQAIQRVGEFSPVAIEMLQEKRHQERGGFSEGIFLEMVEASEMAA